ncbi:MAG TPA: phosphoribosyltransferase family protein, partial [Planctomycetota bacterium]|nr:phosphoribosyltransferase family protein [Planctomycetota bacterium]
MPFQNRIEAARELAKELIAYRGRNPLVLGIPRGAVPMAAVVAEALDGELDVVLVRKLGAPGNSELAIGSISESGQVFLRDGVREAGVSQAYLDREIKQQLKVLRERRELYTPVRACADPAGRAVIIVDNGVATGSTMLAALRSVRARGPEELVAAMAVAPPDTVRAIEAEADKVVVLETPERFFAVGQF